MKQELFAMRRANGDWFAMEIEGVNRVLIFRTLDAAWRMRASNPELMLFWPVALGKAALQELATANEGRPVDFWLVDEKIAQPIFVEVTRWDICRWQPSKVFARRRR